MKTRNIFNGISMLAVLLLSLLVAPVGAEMIVTTNDGRTYRIPVNPNEVSKIEYSRSRQSQGGPVGMSESDSGYRLVGCFTDRNQRDLNGYTFQSSSMTTDLCVSTCRDRGFSFAATQFSTHCFCDNSYGKYGPANNCSMSCSGARGEKCGGTWANSVYRVQ